MNLLDLPGPAGKDAGTRSSRGAQSPTHRARGSDASQILFGTDFPPGGTSQDVARRPAELCLFDLRAARAIDGENAERFLPRLGAAVA